MSAATRRLGVGLGCLLLAACTTPAMRTAPPAPAMDAGHAQALQAARAQWFATHRDWQLTGRVAVGKAGKGGSGRIEWAQHGDDYAVALSAPVTRQSWRLTGNVRSGAGRLEGLDGGPRAGAVADDVLREATGWEIPVNAMPDWVLGLASAGTAVDELRFDDAGRPALLRQAGWTVEYTRWCVAQGDRPALPARIQASRDDASVRLVIDQWVFDGP